MYRVCLCMYDVGALTQFQLNYSTVSVKTYWTSWKPEDILRWVTAVLLRCEWKMDRLMSRQADVLFAIVSSASTCDTVCLTRIVRLPVSRSNSLSVCLPDAWLIHIYLSSDLNPYSWIATKDKGKKNSVNSQCGTWLHLLYKDKNDSLSMSKYVLTMTQTLCIKGYRKKQPFKLWKQISYSHQVDKDQVAWWKKNSIAVMLELEWMSKS